MSATSGARWGAILVCASLASACDKAPPAELSVAPTAAPSALNVPAVAAVDVAAEPAGASPSNPLGLPIRRLSLNAGRRVFAPSERMLSGAKLGSTLILYASTVVGFDGDDLVLEGHSGPNYKVHPAYVIPVPEKNRINLGDPIVTEWNGAMKHAVVTKFVKDRVIVRYTDMDERAREGRLKDARMIKQQDGLIGGNYAALRGADGYRSVLLISPVGEGAERWFVLGFGGAAELADASSLVPIPVKFRAKAGDVVLAEWVGAMREATVQSADDAGIFKVKFERAGRPVTVGWGLIMAPPSPEAAPK